MSDSATPGPSIQDASTGTIWVPITTRTSTEARHAANRQPFPALWRWHHTGRHRRDDREFDNAH